MNLFESVMTSFGFELKKNQPKGTLETVEIVREDGSAEIFSEGGVLGFSANLYQIPTNEAELIRTYRSLAKTSDVDRILNEVRNEIFIFDVPDKKAIDINIKTTEKTKISPALIKKIKDEFDNIYNILDFQKKGLEYLDSFYIDGRIYLQKIVESNNIKKGIQKIVKIDALKMRKMVKYPEPNKQGVFDSNKIEHFFIFSDTIDLYNSSLQLSRVMQMSNDSVSYADSGIYDEITGAPLSYLWKSIVPYNNMKMMEEALLIYRVVRSPERRVFYINVGNLSKPKAEQYIKDLMNRFKNKLVYDSKTGSIVDRKHVMSMVEDYWLPRRDDGKGTEIQTLPGACLSLDTKIPLLDGRVISIREIEKEINDNKELWAYSCNPTTGGFAPGIITWAGTTRKNETVMEIILDNDEKIICTLDHKFPLKNGIKTEAKDLQIGDNLYPLYTKKQKLGGNNTYIQLFENDSKKWEFVHRLVSKKHPRIAKYSGEPQRTVIHHEDFNRYNNNPNNLLIMESSDHIQLHKDYGFTLEQCIKGGLATAKKRKQDLEYSKKMLDIFYEKCLPSFHTKESWEKISKSLTGKKKTQEHIEKLISCLKRGNKTFIDKLKNDIDFYKTWNQNCINAWTNDRRDAASKRMSERNKTTIDHVKNHDKTRIEFPNINDFIEDIKYCSSVSEMTLKLLNNSVFNNKFITLNKDKTNVNFNFILTDNLLRKWIKMSGFANVYEFRQFIKYKNHKIKSIRILDEKMDVGTITIDGNEIYHDWHTFALDAGVYTYNSNLSSIDDVELFRKKFAESTNIPTSRLRDDAGPMVFGRTADISRDEYRFRKYLDRIRNRFVVIFEDLLRTQLLLKNIIVDSDWRDIKNSIEWIYAEDNNFVEWKESEVLNNRLETLGRADAFVGRYFTREWVLKTIMKMDDDTIKTMLKGADEQASKQRDQEAELEPREPGISTDDNDNRDEENDLSDEQESNNNTQEN